MTKAKAADPEQEYDDRALIWYALYTNIKCEKRAQMGLREKGYATCLPVEIRWKRHAKTPETVEKPLFTRYLFVGVAPGQPAFEIRRTDGVEDVLKGSSGYWLTVPAGVISRLRLAMLDGTFDQTLEKPEPPRYAAGQMVRVAEGPFKGFIGKVKVASSRHRVEILMDLFKTEVPATFDPLHIEAA